MATPRTSSKICDLKQVHPSIKGPLHQVLTHYRWRLRQFCPGRIQPQQTPFSIIFGLPLPHRRC
ncbi:MAG TPA: hypothetical protein PLH19_16240 [Anaerolineae bacterium]|nr:hypothetical protein [Anaerolineae bacterium]